jgi:hypothetical protein
MVVVVGLDSAMTALVGARPGIEAAFAAPAAALSLWILIRLGVLPSIVSNFVAALLTTFPLTTDVTAWSSGPTLMALGAVVLLTLPSFRIALAGRPLLQDDFLEASG